MAMGTLEGSHAYWELRSRAESTAMLHKHCFLTTKQPRVSSEAPEGSARE